MWKQSGLAHRADNQGFDLKFENAQEWNESNKQGGITQAILCRDCEGKRGKLETYMSNQIYKHADIVRSAKPGHRIIEGIDYTKAKLFAMFNLFMMGISTHAYYKQVSLGDKHTQKLRQMLLETNAGHPWEYATTWSRLRMNDKSFEGISLPPHRFRSSDGSWMYQYVFAGLLMTTSCSSHPHPWILDLAKNGLDRKLIIFESNPMQIPFIAGCINSWLKKDGHPIIR